MHRRIVWIGLALAAPAFAGGCLTAVAPEPEPGVWSRAAEGAAIRALERTAEAARGVEEYACRFHRYERKGGKMGTRQIADVKFRREPYSLYMRWVDPGKFGAEVLYVAGKYDDTVFARQGGVLFLLPPMRLKPDDELLEQHSRHKITDFNSAGTTLLENARRARAAGSFKARALGPSDVTGEPVDGYEVLLPGGDDYYARRACIWLHRDTGFVARVLAYGDDDELLEDYAFVQYNLDPGFTDADFDPANPAYRF